MFPFMLRFSFSNFVTVIHTSYLDDIRSHGRNTYKVYSMFSAHHPKKQKEKGPNRGENTTEHCTKPESTNLFI